MLVLIARIAFALASDNSNVTVNFGPIDHWVISVAGPHRCRRGAGPGPDGVPGDADGARLARDVRGRDPGEEVADPALPRGELGLAVPAARGATPGARDHVCHRHVGRGHQPHRCRDRRVQPAGLARDRAGGEPARVASRLRPRRSSSVWSSARCGSRCAAGRPRWPAPTSIFATAVTELTATLQEVRIFQVERPVGDMLSDFTDEYTQRALETAYWGGAIAVLYQGISMFFLVGALAVAYGAGFAGLASLGAVVLIMLRSLSYAQSVQSSIQGLHQVAPLLETLQDEEERYAAAALPRDGRPIDHIGDIAFDDVWFEYEEGPPGSPERLVPTCRTARSSASSARRAPGKSTLVQLLLRLRDPTQGCGAERWPRSARALARRLVPPFHVRAPGAATLRRNDRRQHPLLPRRRRRRCGGTRRRSSRTSTRRSRRGRSATTRRWANGAVSSRAVNASGCASHVPSSTSPTS